MSRRARLPLEQLTPYLLDTPTGTLSWPAVFPNNNPVEIEVGFGKGMFLVNAGMSRPDLNFLGIEIARKYQLFAANRLARRELHNVRLACGDAKLYLRDHVPPHSVQALHVYFPDPWWKKKHLKRRLFTGEFAELCQRVLQPGGHLHVATDVEEYFHIITGLIGQQTQLQPQAMPTALGDEEYLTNFERKYRLEGRAIYRECYTRQ